MAKLKKKKQAAPKSSALRNKTSKPVRAAKVVRKPAKPLKPARPAKIEIKPKVTKAPAVDVRPERGEAPPTAVPTNIKPRKNQAGMSSKELEHFRELLLAKRHEIVGDMSSMEREALRSGGGTNLSNLPVHMADMGTDNYEQEFTLGLVEKDRDLLREINSALAKIQDGTFGICEGTGKPITKARLEAKPWARYGIEHARKLERGFGR